MATVLILSLPAHASAMTMEPVLEAGRSFWTLEKQRPYSINFLWGPQIGFTEAQRLTLYSALPPPYYSGTLALNIAIAVILLAILVLSIVQKVSRRILMRRVFTVLLATWIFFDIRMGSEFLSWVYRDYQTYISAPAGEKIFRDRKTFYDFAAYSKQFLTNRPSYVFFAQRPWPYLGNMRYLSYPAIPGFDTANDDTWVIYDRPDISVSADRRIVIDEKPVTPVGTVLGRFDESSFIFRIR